MRRLAVVLLGLAVAPALRGRGASFNPQIGGKYVNASAAGNPVAINSAWRFHTGDDPAWAAPGFDDSQWSLLRIDKTWADQGYKGYFGFAWYRIQVKLPASASPLAMTWTEINSANEIYADGQLIWSIGKMRPKPEWLAYSFVPHSVALPPALNGKIVEIAVRVWEPEDSATNYPFVGRSTNPTIGEKRTIDGLCQLANYQSFLSTLPMWMVGALAALIGFFSIGLFLLRRRSTEYLWAALFLLDNAAFIAGGWAYKAFFWPARPWVIVNNWMEAAMLIFWLLFIWRFLRAPADKLLRIAIALLLVAPIPSLLVIPRVISLTYANVVWVFVPLVIGLLVFARLVRLAVGGNREAQLLMGPFLLSALVNSFGQLLSFLYYAGFMSSSFAWWVVYRGSMFSVTCEDISSLIAYLAVAFLLMMRFTRSAERDERLSAEMQAAHQVQAQLVPAQLPSTPHFRFEAAYLAASEVGGDFYQVFSQADESVLIAIGDVSGKGLKAAMLGTMVVGALNTLAQEDLSPSQILARLNAQLVRSAGGGFVTCCVVRIDIAGLMIIANAGHLPPYRDRQEIPCEPGMPLGMVAGAEYPETDIRLLSGDQLTFLSDGVVEARNATGELFGFERAARMSTQTAESLARAAQHFGQEDDITVVTLSLIAHSTFA